MIKKVKSYFLNFFHNLDQYEQKLAKYSGYEKGSIIDWKNQTGASWKTIKKILSELQIFNENDIRSAYREMVSKHKELFYSENTFIVPFGPTGKSGEKLLYDFRKAIPDLEKKIIEKYEIVEKTNSNLIFLDDIVGTGFQATNYITSSIQQFMTTSNKPYLLTICSTVQGIYEVQQTGFRVLSFNLLEEKKHYYLDESCLVFDKSEKEFLNILNYQLIDKRNRYHLGLLLAFHYSTPDNSMPIIWKNQNEEKKLKWKALLPREF